MPFSGEQTINNLECLSWTGIVKCLYVAGCVVCAAELAEIGQNIQGQILVPVAVFGAHYM